jgi:hypothetical protein
MNFGLAFIGALALSAQPARPPVAGGIDSASWLAGRWVGEGLGGRIEEVWSPAHGGQMVGHFALVREGIPAFYEIMLLDSQPAGLRLRVKHFNPDFTAWEDRGEWHSFEPDSVLPDRLVFRGLIVARSGDEMLITISLREDGITRDHQLRLRRSPL